MKNLFNPDSWLMTELSKLGDMVLVSLLFIIGSLPIFTITVSYSALYYSVVKCIRRDAGQAASEFIRTYKENFKRGAVIGLILLPAILILGADVLLLTNSDTESAVGQTVLQWKESLANGGTGFITLAVIGLALAVLIFLYSGPVLSRFDMKVKDIFRLSFAMAIRFIGFSIVLVIIAVLVLLAQWIFIQVPVFLILPALWCLLSSFITEKALLAYMPPKEENPDAWYYR